MCAFSAGARNVSLERVAQIQGPRAQGPSAYLSRLGRRGPVATFPITAGEWLIGRDPDLCQVVVPDEFRAVGRIHAQVSCADEDEFWIKNLHSNGTYVNDKPLPGSERCPLIPGDVVTLAGPRDSQPLRCTYRFSKQPLELVRVPSTDNRSLLLGENATILLMMSNPVGTSPLRLDEEVRAVDDAIYSARNRDQLDLRQAMAVRISDLQRFVLRHTPTVVHFSGHGSASRTIVLSDEDGRGAVEVPAGALSDLFRLVSPPVHCVVLNACFSDHQAQAIAAHVDYVIGMSRAISDRAALFFSEAFYRALASGLPIGKAFELGRTEIHLRSPRERTIPVLLTKPGAIPDLCLTY